MYLNERNKVLDLLTTVLEAIDYSRKHKDNANTYILDCLLAINEIDAFINEREPEYDRVLLKKAEESLEKAKKTDDISELSRWLRQSDKDIKLLKNNIKEELNVRFQVVFLPYKAAMWTAFDSIWREASKDPNCECIVMPIPYYELDSNGNPKKYCYEKDEYPDYITITHFDDYDIEANFPDMIFIHNPYDDTNNLTRVEPKYFAKNLRNHTNMLIYSPYYTLRSYNPSKGILLCISPATIYSHKIIVQSERMKEIYMEHGHNPNKLIVLGSPKMDAVVNNIKNPPPVPNVWAEKIKDKHVFLINTHFSFFSRYGEKAYEKIKHIIDYFIERQDSVAIWRPHPYTDVYLENKYPIYYELYKDLIKLLENENDGIIDRFPDYSYSFSISKGMFSTYSSLVTEYMITGKPIYVLEKRNNKDINKISPVDYSFNYYYKKGGCSVKKFTSMVIDEKDYFYEERMKIMKKSFINSVDASSGEKTYNQFKKEILNQYN